MDYEKKTIEILSNGMLNDFSKGHKILEVVHRMDCEIKDKNRELERLNEVLSDYQNLKEELERIKSYFPMFSEPENELEKEEGSEEDSE